MTAVARCLSPTVEERLSRVQCDLRLGLPCRLTDGDKHALVLAIEPLETERLNALCTLFGQPLFILTPNRASTLKLTKPFGSGNAWSVCVAPPERADAEWFRQIADTSRDFPTEHSLNLASPNATEAGLSELAITLVKSAELLPAALMFPLAADQTVPSTLGITDLELSAAKTVLARPSSLAHVTCASLPVEAHDAGRLHVFRDPDGIKEHYAFEIGSPDRSKPVLSRVHSACFTGDVLGSLKCDCGPQLRTALQRIGAEGSGVLLYLNQEGRGIGLANKMRVYHLQSQGLDTVEANKHLGFADDERDFRIAATIYSHLGFTDLRLLTNNPAKVHTLQANGINVTERLPLSVGHTPQNEAYLATKALKSGHAL